MHLHTPYSEEISSELLQEYSDTFLELNSDSPEHLLSFQKMRYLLDELNQLEVLIKPPCHHSKKGDSTEEPRASNLKIENLSAIEIEKMLFSLLDHVIFEDMSYDTRIACEDLLFNGLSSNVQHIEKYPHLDLDYDYNQFDAQAALLNHRNTRIASLRVISELNSDRKRSGWISKNFISISPKNDVVSSQKASSEELTEDELNSLLDDFMYRLKNHLCSSFRKLAKPELYIHISANHETLKTEFRKRYAEFVFEKKLVRHGWPPLITKLLMLQQEKTGKEYIHTLRNIDIGKNSFSLPKDLNKNLKDRSSCLLAVNDFFQIIKKADWPYPPNEVILSIKRDLLFVSLFHHNHSILDDTPQVTNPSFLQNIEAALNVLVECVSAPSSKLSYEELFDLRYFAKLSADEILSIEQARLSSAYLLENQPDFANELSSLWKDYAFHVYGKKTTTQSVWEKKNHEIIEESTSYILNKVYEIQASLYESRLLPILLFLICADTARMAFETNPKRQKLNNDPTQTVIKQSAELRSNTGYYYLLNENSNLFPKTKALQERQQEACELLFVKIRHLFSEFLLVGSLSQSLIDDTPFLQINEKTLSQASDQYFPYIVSFNTRLALRKILLYLRDSFRTENDKSDMHLLLNQFYEIEELFLGMILAECRSAHLKTLPQIIIEAIPETYQKYLSALIEVTKTQNVLRFFVLGEGCEEFENSVNLLFNLIKNVHSINGVPETTDYTAKVSLKQKYIELAEEFHIVFEDVSPHLFWAITEYSPCNRHLAYQTDSGAYTSFPLSQAEQLIAYTLAEDIDVCFDNIYQYHKDCVAQQDPSVIEISTSHILSVKYATHLYSYCSKKYAKHITPSNLLIAFKHLQKLLEKVFSEFSYDNFQMNFEGFMHNDSQINSCKKISFDFLSSEIELVFSQIFDLYLKTFTAPHISCETRNHFIYDPSLPINKHTIKEFESKFLKTYLLTLFLNAAEEAVRTVLKKYFSKSSETQSSTSSNCSLGKLARKKWTLKTAVALFQTDSHFTNTTAFLDFLKENISYQKACFNTSTDALTASKYLNECLSWSRDCVVEKVWELIQAYYKRFYPFRVSTFNPGLTKRYLEKSNDNRQIK